MSAFRIAVVDDDPVLRELVGGYLALAGYAVRTFAGAREALASMMLDPPDLALVDVCMPGIDGFGLLERIRRMARLEHVPVFLLSAVNDSDAKVRGLDAGADDYLTKDTPPAEVLARVRTGLRRGARYRRLQGALAGTLGPDLTLDTVVQALSHAPRPARVRFLELAADLVCSGGAIRACRFGRAFGPQALERVLLVARGRFAVEFDDHACEPDAPRLDLLAALVAADEARAIVAGAAGGAPPATLMLAAGASRLPAPLAPYASLLPAPSLWLAALADGDLREAARRVAEAIAAGALLPIGATAEPGRGRALAS